MTLVWRAVGESVRPSMGVEPGTEVGAVARRDSLLEEIRVVNFRSARRLVLRPGRVCAFIGEPGAGKSNVLFALRALLDPSFDLSTADATFGEREISIQATLTDGRTISPGGSDGGPPVVHFPAARRGGDPVAATAGSSVAEAVHGLVRDALAATPAPRVALVRGLEAKIALPFVFRALGHDADREQISIVECGGKTNLPLFAEICRRARVPYVVVHDSDLRPGRTPADAELRTNARIRRKAGARRTIVLEPDFEAVVGMRRSKDRKPERAWRYLAHADPDELPAPLVRAVRLALASALPRRAAYS